ncbi:5a31956d-f7f6-4cbb-8259-f132d9f87a01 [Thermothielavioides terrestris]|uniref:5a31956d-f7f6-4cbb-8259-f132d9f87a01 n=1 Tax=Thermothielavioides terrestris TaxID=2587410 RepID=A0A446B5D7_9PEZI|nr:5a31956d-f7f6-4cbb-8259-f132d9f87a01 [Thermothielavioides terrestris]
MGPSKQQRLLWVNATEPAGVRRRDKATMTKIRRHVMEDIGKSRRKPPRNPQFVIDTGPPPAPARHPEVNSPLPPFWSQDPLSILEQQWQMDTFSAYGISLLVAEGKRLLCNADPLTSEGFSFPFAFKSAAFLRHFRAVFSDPSVLKGIYHQSSARIRVMALERALGTISCIGATVANPSFHLATADRVIHAVLY